MKFEIHPLNSILSPYIESLFHFENFMPDHAIERVVPTGHLFIIFALDGMTRKTFDNDTLRPNDTFSKAWVSGVHKNYISISAHQNSEMLVIQFKPYGAFPFLKSSVDSFNDTVVPAENIFGDDILNLHEKIVTQETTQTKLKVAAKWIENKFDNSKTPPADIINIVHQLQNEPTENHKTIIDDYAKTQKHLINQFKKYVGVTPKYYHRIVRFNKILQLIQKREMIPWGQIAYECNYTDQSHFIKDFKYFSGFNPTEFINNNFDKGETNFFPLD